MMIFASFVVTTVVFSITCDATLIDLSHKIDFDTIPNYPTSPLYNLTNRARVFAVNGTVVLDTNVYTTMEHSSTHIDAPIHARPVDDDDAATVDEIPLENTVAFGVMIDCTVEAAADPSYTVTKQKILNWEFYNGPIPPKAAVLINFGYSQYFVNNQEKYRGTNDLDNAVSYVFPNVSAEAVEYLLEHRDMLILGTDTISPDSLFIDGQLAEFPVHLMMFAKGRVIVENLNNLSALPPRGFIFSVAPAKFVGASGVQVRAYATTLFRPPNILGLLN